MSSRGLNFHWHIKKYMSKNTKLLVQIKERGTVVRGKPLWNAFGHLRSTKKY